MVAHTPLQTHWLDGQLDTIIITYLKDQRAGLGRTLLGKAAGITASQTCPVNLVTITSIGLHYEGDMKIEEKNIRET